MIEDIFMNGQRLDPATDGRPDLRPDVRENVSILGDLLSDFDFGQPPRPALILSTFPAPGPALNPNSTQAALFTKAACPSNGWI